MAAIQKHHIFYKTVKENKKRESQREIVVELYQHEHKIITDIQRLRPENTSRGFWHSLRVLTEAYEPFSHMIISDDS